MVRTAMYFSSKTVRPITGGDMSPFRSSVRGRPDHESARAGQEPRFCFRQPEQAFAVGAGALFQLVRGGSEVGGELDAPFLGIAAELVLAGVGRFSGQQASRRLPFALPKEKWPISDTQPGHRNADTLPLRE